MRIKLSLVAKTLAAAALATVILTPPAAGSTSAQVKLAVIPLPQKVIGSVAKGLQLSYFSGPISNSRVVDFSMNGSKKTFQKLGRITGYQLDYGVAESGGSGVTAVLTGVERYKTSTGARRAFAFWKRDDSLLSRLNTSTFSVTNTLLTVPAVGKARFAYLTSYSAANIAPLSTADERILEGKYVLQVKVSAGTAAAATALAPKLATKLDARLRQALHGRLHAKPVKLRTQPKGQVKNAPVLSKLAVTKADLLPGESVLAGRTYVRDPSALSCYQVVMIPAGDFDILINNTEWYATANQAAFRADYLNASVLAVNGSTAVDLSSVGHDAQGAIASDSSGYLGQFSLTVGQLDEFVIVFSETVDIQAFDLQTLAQKLADRLDPVYSG